MKNRILHLLFICSLCLFVTTVLLTTSNRNSFLHAATSSKMTRDLVSQLQSSGSARVIVQLNDPIIAAGENELDAIAAAQASVFGSLNPADFTLTHRYHSLPAFAGTFTADGIAALQANPVVASIVLDLPGGAHLSESIPALRADIVSDTYGITGKGITVAVLDSGIDTTHVDLADAIVGQHCFTSANCQPGNVNENSNAQDLNGHGTHVSGIVTANGMQAYRGFAPNAEIVAVRVLDQNGSGWVSDWIAGLDWLNANFATRPVPIVNMSLGTFTLFTGNCDANQPSMAIAINNLRAKGVVIFASSGNQGSFTQIASPACNSGVVAVGATYDSNAGRQPSSGTYNSLFGGSWPACSDNPTSLSTITCFTNSNNQLDILAPGAPIQSTALGGGKQTFYGTSQASPTAAGIAALMLEKDPSLTPDEIESLLKSSGINVTDPRNSLVIPRISAVTAVNAVDFFNNVAPTSVAIDGPSNGMTNSTYSFTATVAPTSTSLPITYSWSARGTDTTYVFTDGRTSNVSFTWLQAGPQVVTVTAENDFGSVIDTHAIELSQPNTIVPISSVAIEGANSGLVDRALHFTATVSPVDASLPVTFSWQADGQPSVLSNGGREESVNFSWSQPGTYAVTVTATNAGGQAAQDTLSVKVKTTTPQSVALKGPLSGNANQSITFLASVLPLETETPVTYTWRATDQNKMVNVGKLNDNVKFNWSVAGVYTVSVQAENSRGSVTASRTITINEANTIVPIESVTLIAPDIGFVDQLLRFTATVSPPDATAPITYLWEPLGQENIEQLTGNNASIALSWTQTGTYPIKVTVSNGQSLVSATQDVEIATIAAEITGPSFVSVGKPVTFTATLTPDGIPEPVTYLWSASNQETITNTGGLSDRVTFRWDTNENVTVTVQVDTSVGEISTEKKIEVVSEVKEVYLPLVAR